LDVKAESKAQIRECSWRRIVVPNEKPAARRHHTGILYEDKLYVFGGALPSKAPTNDFYVFDFGTTKWELVSFKGEPPGPRCGHTAVLYDKKMWIFAGFDNQRTAFNDLHFFDFETKEWKKVEQSGDDLVWPNARYFHSGTLVGDKFYLFGGAISKSKFLNDVYTFSFDTKKWTAVAPQPGVPDIRAGHLAFEHSNKWFIFGGFTGDGGYTNLLDTHYLDLEKNTWHEIEISGTFPRTFRPLSHVFDQPNGLVYLFGGSDGKNPLGGLLQFEISTGTWRVINMWLEMDNTESALSAISSSKGLLPIPRHGHSTVMDANGVITIFAGSGSLYLNDLFQIDLNEHDE